MKKKVICIVLYGLLAAACCVFLVFTIKNMYTTYLSLKQIEAIFSSYDNDYKYFYKSYIKSLVYNFLLGITLLLVISTLIWQIIVRCVNFDFSIHKSLEKIKKKRAERKEKSLIKKFERTQKKYKELEEEINRKGA